MVGSDGVRGHGLVDVGLGGVGSFVGVAVLLADHLKKQLIKL